MRLVKDLKKQGFTVERTGGGHWRVTNERGDVAFLSFSPRSSGLHRTLKRLRAMGYKP